MMQMFPKRGDSPSHTLASTDSLSLYQQLHVLAQKGQRGPSAGNTGSAEGVVPGHTDWRLEDMPSGVGLQEPTYSHTYCAQ